MLLILHQQLPDSLSFPSVFSGGSAVGHLNFLSAPSQPRDANALSASRQNLSVPSHGELPSSESFSDEPSLSQLEQVIQCLLLFLCIGAKVLLTMNIWQHAGLCNGAVGTVVDIVYDDESIAPGLPVCVLVDFKDDYTGPPIWTPPYSRTIIPIFPVTANWASPTGGGDLVQHSRIMLPLKLSFAWTMWRVQGQTIRSKVVLHLGKTEKEHGLTYTGFSRATKFQNIGIAGGLPLSRLTTKIANQSKMKRRIKEEKKLAKLAAQTRRNVVNNR